MCLNRNMKKIMTTLLAAATLASCGSAQKTEAAGSDFAADTTLTSAEIAARRLTPEVMLKMGRISSTTLSPDGKTILYTLGYQDVAGNTGTSSLWTMPSAGGPAVQLTEWGKSNSPSWSADSKTIYFLDSSGGTSQLWSIGADGTGIRQISALDKDVAGYGVSPKGDNVWLTMDVAVEKVKSAEAFADMPKSKALIYDDLMVRHWDTWEDGSYSHLFLAPLTAAGVGVPVDLTPDEPWDVPTAPYFDTSEITWNNAGTAIAYTCKKLTGYEYSMSTNTDIYLYNIGDKSTKNLTEGMPGYDKYPVFSPDDSFMAWQSMERAGNEADKDRLFVMNMSTGEKSYLTYAFDYNAASIKWSDDGREVFFIAPIAATHQLCKVGVEARNVEVLTSGLHDYISMSKAGNTIVAEKTTLSMATEIFGIDIASGKDTQLSYINSNIYANTDMGRVEQRMVTTTDGKQMLVWVILPPDFDPAKKYPTLLYCEGGPQSVVSQRWSYRWNFQLMAAEGYVVVAPNRRGLPSFGQQWLDQISGDYSGQNIADYLSAIDDVAKEPWVDTQRLGCVGASYGGYSVYYLAGHHKGRFKAFISHCGMFNLESFYGETEELWFPTNDLGGPYWATNNPTAKRSYANSPHLFVNNWTTPMLIITGEKDYRIPYTQSLQAFTAARAHGIPSRLVVFQDEAHQVFKPQNALVWNREFFGWLNKYLKQ